MHNGRTIAVTVAPFVHPAVCCRRRPLRPLLQLGAVSILVESNSMEVVEARTGKREREREKWLKRKKGDGRFNMKKKGGN